jgi:GNAT superfamily N-acetyltransferase
VRAEDVVIRVATPRDESAVLELDGSEESARRRRLADVVAQSRCVVAEVDGRIVGFATRATFYEYDFLELLVVDKRYRRRGIGTALARQIEATCTSGKLFTSTNQSNVAMQALCRRLGYEPSGIIHNLDENDPELVYVKRLLSG